MSRATNQTAVMLSIVAGCLAGLHDQKVFSRVDMKQELNAAIVDTVTTAQNWENTGNIARNDAWREQKFDEWKLFLFAIHSDYSPAMLMYVADRVLQDLAGKLKNKAKLAHINRLAKPISRFSDFVDPLGRNFPAQEDSGRIMDRLYQILEWED